MQKRIGGYFELELPVKQEYHLEALALNSGRFCLEYLLRCKKYKKVYVPYFTCDSALEPIRKLNIPHAFYHIDTTYHIVDSILLKKDEALLYTNYWGLMDDYCLELYEKYGQQLILDYTQAFFSKAIAGCDTFYSCRKFFGVPDGGYLYTDIIFDFKIQTDESYKRIDSLIKRIDLSPEAGYVDFQKTSELFHDMPIRYMSKFTKRMMAGLDYLAISKQRKNNYNYLANALGEKLLDKDAVPMIFPYKCEAGQELRKYLIEKKIFVAKYWPNVDTYEGVSKVEAWMTNHILPLPIDQRYSEEDMDYIVQNVNEFSTLK